MKVFVIVRDGLVTAAFSDQSCDLQVVDFDDLEAEGEDAITEAELYLQENVYNLPRVY